MNLSTKFGTRSAANQLLENNKYNYEYDGLGNLTKKTEKETNKKVQYIYDPENRLIEVKNSNYTIDFVYDATGRRISKSVSSASGQSSSPPILYFLFLRRLEQIDGNRRFHARFRSRNGEQYG